MDLITALSELVLSAHVACEQARTDCRDQHGANVIFCMEHPIAHAA